MPPREKLPKIRLKSKVKLICPKCPYCGFEICWKHSKYERKGFHRPQSEHQHGVVEIQRYLCQCPSCKHTFNKLPEKVLPYTRFFIDGLLDIKKEHSTQSAYSIAKNKWNLPLKVVLRAINKINSAKIWLSKIYQEKTGKLKNDFSFLIRFLRKNCSWFTFTRNWFHHFYPSRISHIFNPHNLGINDS